MRFRIVRASHFLRLCQRILQRQYARNALADVRHSAGSHGLDENKKTADPKPGRPLHYRSLEALSDYFFRAA